MNSRNRHIYSSLKEIFGDSLLAESYKNSSSMKYINEANMLTSPSMLQVFMDKNEKKQDVLLTKMGARARAIASKIWEYLKYAVSQGLAFIQKHWKTIFNLALLILVLWGAAGCSKENSVADKAASFISNKASSNERSSSWPGVELKKSSWPGKEVSKSDWPGTNVKKSNWPGI